MLKSTEDMVHRRWGSVPEMTRFEQELAYIGLGLTGEAGEVADEIKKRLRTGGRDRDLLKLKLEAGDVLFYWIRLCFLFGWTQEEVELAVQEKLAKREFINDPSELTGA